MRQRQTAQPGTPEADRLEAEATRLREEYHALSDDAVRHHMPDLPPFPPIFAPDDDEPPRHRRRDARAT